MVIPTHSQSPRFFFPCDDRACSLVMICMPDVPFDRCWPDTAGVVFVMQDSEFRGRKGDPTLAAVARRGITLGGRYVVNRIIWCSPRAVEYSDTGKGHLPEPCREMGSADGHCTSPLFKGVCPN